ncbi:MAG: ABC transporter permease [Lachnospiraceae bacterium]|nr:ABC transporter permease [Robinsoniella sp.]MDY3767576.1 ABC transporter permease [Lachnospiraceae bacterium]
MKQKKSYYIILIAAVITLNFFLPRCLPGSPISQIIGENVGGMLPEERERILETYHLNDSLPEQFIEYIKNIFTLDWGISYSKKQPIKDLIFDAIPWTLLLCGTNLILSTVLGTVLGTASAMLRKKKKDLKIVGLMTILGSMPSFWIGMVLISFFGVKLGWFPIYGAYSVVKKYTGVAKILDILRHLVLPVITMTIVSLMSFFTTSRVSVLETIHQDYVTLAEMRGIPKKRIQVFYIMRNALIPVFTVFMLEVGYVLSGSVVIESLFSYPGIGYLLYNAVLSRDYPLMQYGFLITSVMVILASWLTDVLYCKIDPRMVSMLEK